MECWYPIRVGLKGRWDFSWFLYQIRNRYSKLFGYCVNYYDHIIITIILYVHVIRTCLIIWLIITYVIGKAF